MKKSPTAIKHALLGALMMIGTAGIATAQPAQQGFPPPMPETKGKVAQYSITPRGDVDGFILVDGTEVLIPKHTSTRLVFSVRPGDAVTIQGLKTGASAAITAVAVINDATGAVVFTDRHAPPQHLDHEGRIKQQLHDPKGNLNGVLLEDGTIVRMPPPDAERIAGGLGVGQPLYVRGDGHSSTLGTMVAAREVGPSRTQLTKVNEPFYKRWMHDVFGDDDDDAPPPSAPKTP